MSYHPAEGFGGWFAVRHQNQRPFDKINEAYMPSFFEYDIGLSYTFGVGARVGRRPQPRRQPPLRRPRARSATRRIYVAPPRRFLGELAVKF